MNRTVDLHLGDCLEVLRGLEAGSVDAVVTDPPAGIGFMGKSWDKPGVLGVSGGRAMPATMASRNPICRSCRLRQRTWQGGPPACACERPDFDDRESQSKERGLFEQFLSERLAEARRVIRPGGFMLCWALPRTSHWTANAIEAAGWTIRDRVSRLFGTGFPKSKSCLKPAAEDWWLAKAPGPLLPLEIDAARIEGGERTLIYGPPKNGADPGKFRSQSGYHAGTTTQGRWPANVALTCACEAEEHAEGCPVLEIGRQSGERTSGTGAVKRATAKGHKGNAYGADNRAVGLPMVEYGDTGTAARYFYTSKASRADRNEGLEGMPERRTKWQEESAGNLSRGRNPVTGERTENVIKPSANHHPTVKSTDLMRWLCRLVTPPGGTVLDPFMGSGSTGKACMVEGFGFVGVEREADYFTIAERRIGAARPTADLFDLAGASA